MRVDGPVFDRVECVDLAFAFDNQPQRHGLHAAGTQPATHLVPQQRADLISHQAVQHTPRLLRVDQVFIDLSCIQKRSLDSLRRDLIKSDALDLG